MRWPSARSPAAGTGFTYTLTVKLFKVDLIERPADNTPDLCVKIPAPLCQVLGWETEKEFNLNAGWKKPDDTDRWQTGSTISTKTDQNRCEPGLQHHVRVRAQPHSGRARGTHQDRAAELHCARAD